MMLLQLISFKSDKFPSIEIVQSQSMPFEHNGWAASSRFLLRQHTPPSLS